MSIFALTLSLLYAGILSSPMQFKLEDADSHFEQFIKTYKRHYASEEEKQMRFEVFKQTLQKINQQNFENKNAAFGINNFADITTKEFLSSYSYGYKKEPEALADKCKNITDINLPNAPETLDWREKNVVTRVKDQSHCGSCYAFSLIGNIEGQYAIKYNELVEFSKQQIVDCDWRSYGCNGGWMYAASLSLRDIGGIISEKDYPYQAIDQKCYFNSSQVRAEVLDCHQYHRPTENYLMKILHSHGPVAISIDFRDVMFYKKGIINICRPNYPNIHAVLLVGFGKENDVPYWIIKNSLGENFGEKGYFRLKRGINACGLLDGEITSVVLK